ncbi:MAG: CheW protein [Thermoleophilia bacterium]|nr:CheW protein [Thermoleophilia bacterium]
MAHAPILSKTSMQFDLKRSNSPADGGRVRSDACTASAPREPQEQVTSRMAESHDPTLQIVAFSVDGVEYAFRIASVKEIIRYVEPQPTSSVVTWMLGVINLRGSIVPIIDLGNRMGRAAVEADPRSAKILVLEDGTNTIGAVVTSVDEVRTISSADVQPAPSAAGSSYIDSVVTVDDRLIMLLDATQLLTFQAAAA